MREQRGTGNREPGTGSRIGYRGRGYFVVMAAVLLCFSASIAGALTENQLRQQADVVAAKLRCPVCQNLSVADSNSFMANQIKDKIRKQIAEGKSEQEIIAYFQSKYGDWILLSPPRKGFDLTVWLLPFAGFAAGGVVLMLMLRGMAGKKQGESSAAPAPEEKSGKKDAPVNEAVKKELENYDY